MFLLLTAVRIDFEFTWLLLKGKSAICALVIIGGNTISVVYLNIKTFYIDKPCSMFFFKLCYKVIVSRGMKIELDRKNLQKSKNIPCKYKYYFMSTF